ncbi:MAG: PfkB family carbohydrate kinase [Oscillospiraceae bacterium]|jgi:1-phosphofructokinase|nr:PfkB family carbohydrate kinase [Oscillospiraceae bacterium]
MVVTVTLNPALDVTARTGRLRLGETNRLSESVVNAGGKGVNAARAARVLGGEALAVGFAGGPAGELLLRLLAEEGLPHTFIRVPGGTRVNMKLLDAEGNMTELNGPGGAAGEDAYREARTALVRLCQPGTVFVLSGSLPPDAEPGLYGGLIRLLRGGGAKVVLDTDGEALRLGVLAGPEIAKPNREEMRYVCRDAFDGLLVHSLDAEGVRFYGREGAWFIPALTVGNPSPAGAGDCMTGALAYALDKELPFEEAALLSAAAAAAAVMTPGTNCPPRELVEDCRKRLTLTRV